MDERPREKMLEKGPSALSNAELLAIMIRTGTGKMNPKTSIEQEKAIFKTKWLEKLRKFNFDRRPYDYRFL